MGDKRNPRIVCFGGGSALPKVVLEELKKYPVKITSVTSMLESGGSTGQLRKNFNILPPGDISRHLIALSKAPQWKKSLFYFRFGKEKFPGGHIGHRFGTVFIALLEYLLKDFEKANKITHEFLEIKNHQALPATLQKTNLFATLENNQIIKGEDEIDIPKKHNPKLKIKKVFLGPPVKAYSETIKAIKKSDFIIIGPGDIYSSLIPCFLPKGIKETIAKSRAKKIYICNIMTKLGESNNFSVKDFTKEIEKYIGCSFDFVLYNNKIPDKNRLKRYKKEEHLFLDLVKTEELDGKKFIGRNLLIKKGPLLHDSKKVVNILLKLCKL